MKKGKLSKTQELEIERLAAMVKREVKPFRMPGRVYFIMQWMIRDLILADRELRKKRKPK